ncbi:MAG: plastocyanin/azurin family copper-binding protein [Chloroflexota bacterium]
MIEARSAIGLAIMIVVAAGIGVLAAGRQSHTIAAPRPTPTVAPLPVPGRGEVIISSTHGGVAQAQFIPGTITVRVGQKITWLNQTGDDHTVTANDGSFNSGIIKAGSSFSWTPRHAGTYPYSCYLHGESGTVVVTG